MESPNTQNPYDFFKPVPIAPAPSNSAKTSPLPQPTMPYTCLSCARRKIRCDKLTPSCSPCRKGKLECCYQAPAPRRRKRKNSGDLHDKITQYERILRDNNLLPSEDDTPGTDRKASTDRTQDSGVYPLRFLEPETARLGKLLLDDDGKSRYVDSNFWRSLGDDEMPMLEDEDNIDYDSAAVLSLDPLTAAMMGSTLDLAEYHPSYGEAQILWKAHVENIEPITKILHIPSTTDMIRRVSAQPAMASKNEECLLFAIYHFAVFSMTNEQCVLLLHEPRETLLQRYQFAAKQALVNANFLKATELVVLQAYTLYLMPCRFSYEPNLLWILTGVAVRLAQRIGLHRDGEKLGLPPFEVQMRRRLFFQLVPLDGAASQMSGVGIAMMPHTWDTAPPLNLNDDQIYPGMQVLPEEIRGPTDMIFTLTRATLGMYFAKTGTMGHGGNPQSFENPADMERIIQQAESEVEEKFLRYCDPINPLHYLTMGLARAAVNAMRIRVRLPKVRDKTATREEKQVILQAALKILDTDAAAYENGGLKKYLWHAKAFFAWGSWDSLIFILTTLRKPGDFTPTEVDAAWLRVEQAYLNHGEFLGFRRSMQNVAIARLVLKSWDANPPSSGVPEPMFITALRSMCSGSRKQGNAGSSSSSQPTMSPSSSDPSPPSDFNAAFGTSSVESNLEMGADFDLDTTDWVFWEKLIKDFQSQG